MTTLTYGDFSHDSTALPAATIDALLSRGYARFMGNEQASKIGARIKAKITDGTDRKIADVTEAEVGTFRTERPADVAAITQEVMADAVNALTQGTIGVWTTSAQPKRDPIEAEMHSIASAAVKAILKARGIAVPKKGESVTFGNGKTMTVDDMVAGWLTKNADSARKDAEKAVAERARKIKKAVDGAAQVESPEELF